ncbi:MAG: hypothetical protein K6F75_05330 [Butyrivibrio sp.]|nr:hypothetical protein [Butyrivibrio sp.]
MKTEQDVINALREVHFLERTAELSQKFKRDFSVKPKTPRRDKVHAILAKLGYTSSLRYGWYDIDARRDTLKNIVDGVAGSKNILDTCLKIVVFF